MDPTYERIYHYHVRKTAGTSLNSAFWALANLDYLRDTRIDVTANGLRFVRFDSRLFETGGYFFADSHCPAHQLRLPPNTFTVTILRDPVARAVSYYRYLRWAFTHSQESAIEPALPSLKPEVSTVTSGFRRFLELVPEHHLLAQLAMFSEQLDPLEAADNVLKCTAVCFTESFAEDLKKLSITLGLDLREMHERRFGESVSLKEDELGLLRARLQPEYLMLDRVRDRLLR